MRFTYADTMLLCSIIHCLCNTCLPLHQELESVQASVMDIHLSATPVSASMQELVDGKQRLEIELLKLQESIKSIKTSGGGFGDMRVK